MLVPQTFVWYKQNMAKINQMHAILAPVVKNSLPVSLECSDMGMFSEGPTN